MKVYKFILILIPILSAGCFLGADGYEKNVNDYFWIYKNEGNQVCLGVYEGEYRLANGYECGIKKIGWDDKFLIFTTGKENFYIQDLRILNSNHPEKYKHQLRGPITKKQFEESRRLLYVSDDLDFTISY